MGDQDNSLELGNLEALQKLCTDVINMEKQLNSHVEAISYLDKLYELSKEDKETLEGILSTKAKKDKNLTADIENKKKKIKAYCTVCEVKINDKDDKFIGYQKIKSRVMGKINRINN